MVQASRFCEVPEHCCARCHGCQTTRLRFAEAAAPRAPAQSAPRRAGCSNPPLTSSSTGMLAQVPCWHRSRICSSMRAASCCLVPLGPTSTSPRCSPRLQPATRSAMSSPCQWTLPMVRVRAARPSPVGRPWRAGCSQGSASSRERARVPFAVSRRRGAFHCSCSHSPLDVHGD